MSDNRLKLFRADQQIMADLMSGQMLSWAQRDGCFLRLPTPINLPEGTSVASVHYDYATRSFVFIIKHDSFPPVSQGETIPEIQIEYRTVELKVK